MEYLLVLQRTDNVQIGCVVLDRKEYGIVVAVPQRILRGVIGVDMNDHHTASPSKLDQFPDIRFEAREVAVDIIVPRPLHLQIHHQ